MNLDHEKWVGPGQSQRGNSWRSGVRKAEAENLGHVQKSLLGELHITATAWIYNTLPNRCYRGVKIQEFVFAFGMEPTKMSQNKPPALS